MHRPYDGDISYNYIELQLFTVTRFSPYLPYDIAGKKHYSWA